MSLITDISNGLQAKKRALQKHELAMGSSEASQEYSKYMTVLSSDFKKLLNNHQIQTSDYNALRKAVFIGRISPGKRLKHNLTMFLDYAQTHINYYKNKRYPGPLTKKTDSTNEAYLHKKEAQDYKNMTEKQRQGANIDSKAIQVYSKDLQNKTMSLDYINNDIYDNLVYKYQISVNAWRQIPVKWLPVEGHDVINLVNRGIVGLDKVHARIEERYAQLPHVGGDESATSSSSNVVYTQAPLVRHAHDSKATATNQNTNNSSVTTSNVAHKSHKSKHSFFGKMKNAFKSLKEPYNANDVSSSSVSSLNQSAKSASASSSSQKSSSATNSSSFESSLQARVASIDNSKASKNSVKSSESRSASSKVDSSMSSHMSFGLRTNTSVSKHSGSSKASHSSNSSNANNTNALRQMFNNAKQQRPTAHSVSIHETSSASSKVDVEKSSVSASKSVASSLSASNASSKSVSLSLSASAVKSHASSVATSISNSQSYVSSKRASYHASVSASASASAKAKSQSIDNARIRSALRQSAKVAHSDSSNESHSASSMSHKASNSKSSMSSIDAEEYSKRLSDLFMSENNGKNMVKGSSDNMPKSTNQKIQFHSVNPSATSNSNSINVNQNTANNFGATSSASSAQTPQSLGNSLLNEIVSATRHFGSLSNADRINDVNTVSNREMTISNLKTKVSTIANESAKKLKSATKQGKEMEHQASLSADRGYSVSSASASKSADKAVANTQQSDKSHYDAVMAQQRSNYQSQANQANQETSQTASSSAQDMYKSLSNSASYSAEQRASNVADNYSKKIDSKNDTIDSLKANLTNMTNKAKNFENRVKKIDAIIGK